MNLFFLSENIQECAYFHCDKHVVKMILELAQLLYCVHHVLLSEHLEDCPYKPYKKTHQNHPTAKWVRESTGNYKFTAELGLALCAEYTHRYGKIHATQKHLEWLSGNIPSELNEGVMVPPPLAMPDEYKTDDPVESYRKYYNGDKSSFAKWTKREIPQWFILSELHG